MAVNPLRGNRAVSISIGAQEFSGDILEWSIEGSDPANPTFGEVAGSGVVGDFVFKVKARQDLTSATLSLWRYLFAQAGTTGVAVVVKPYAAAASAAKPWISFSVDIKAVPPHVGGGAALDGKAIWEFNYEFPFVDGTIPVLVIV